MRILIWLVASRQLCSLSPSGLTGPSLLLTKSFQKALQKIYRIFWEFQNLRGEWGNVNISKQILFHCTAQLTRPKKLVNSGQNFQRGGIGPPLGKNSPKEYSLFFKVFLIWPAQCALCTTDENVQRQTSEPYITFYTSSPASLYARVNHFKLPLLFWKTV